MDRDQSRMSSSVAKGGGGGGGGCSPPYWPADKNAD